MCTVFLALFITLLLWKIVCDKPFLSFTHHSTTLHFCFFYYFIYIVGRILFFLGLRNSCYNLNACSKKKKKTQTQRFMKFPSSLFRPPPKKKKKNSVKHVCVLGSTGLAWVSFHDLGLNWLWLIHSYVNNGATKK